MSFLVTVLQIGAIFWAPLLATAFPEQNLVVDVQEPKVTDIQYTPETSQENSINGTLDVEPQGRISYSGSQLWQVCIEDDAAKKIVVILNSKKDLSTWGGNESNIDVMVKPESLKVVSELLKENNIKYKIIIDDIQRAIDEENPPLSEDIEDLENRQGHRLTWSAYHRLRDIHGYLDYLATSYPSICSVRTIGTSVQGRPLKLLKISNGRSGNKAVWIDGGIHAREWISPATVTYIINTLVDNFENEPSEIQNIDWHILPVTNPDGYEYSHTVDRLWRKNRSGLGGRCSGTDLNRNFGYKWGGQGSSKNPCMEIYAGAGPFSEPETASIRNYITGTEAYTPWRAYISFHSYGQYILHPWGYDRVVPQDHHELKSVGNKMAAAIRATTGAYYKVGSSATMLYPAAGGSDDWAKGVAGLKYAYTIELRDTGSYGFVLPAAFINPTAKEALAAIKVIAGAASAA